MQIAKLETSQSDTPMRLLNVKSERNKIVKTNRKKININSLKQIVQLKQSAYCTVCGLSIGTSRGVKNEVTLY